jgi:hypothetical protein
MLLRSSQPGFKRIYIQPQIGIGVEADERLINVERVIAQELLER